LQVENHKTSDFGLRTSGLGGPPSSAAVDAVGSRVPRDRADRAVSMKPPLLPLVLFLIVFLVYSQVHSFEFLRFDDHDYTFLCPFVKDGLSWANIKAAFASFRHAAIWMPLTYISYMADISFFGPGMGAHHLVNAAIHAANSALFYLLLWRMFCRGSDRATPTYSLFTITCSLLWALHPMRVEPVAWIAGRKELLCAFFTLLGLLSVVARRKIVPVVCCVAACMSKPTGMCFPFLAMCVAAVVRYGSELRTSDSGLRTSGLGDSPPKPFPQLFTIHYPLLLVLIAAATGLIAVYSQTHAEGYDVRTLFTAPFSVRALNALKSLGLYIFKSIIPFDLHIDCRWPTPNLPADGWGTILAAIAGLALIGLWTATSLRIAANRNGGRGATALPLLLFFFFAIAPTLGIFGSFGREARADRFMYIPSMAISMVLMAAVSSKPPYRFSQLPILILSSLVVIYSICTFRLIPTFRNDYTAFSRVLACDPVHPRALSHVASEECARFKNLDAGIGHFRDSLACEWNRDTACQLAFALVTRGRNEDISDIRALGESTGIAKKPESDSKGLMAEALGMAALKDRRWRDATIFFAAAVRAPARLYPADDAYVRLGVALANGGRHKEAEQVFAALVHPKTKVRESVRAFAERALEQLASSNGGRIMLFY